MGRNTFYILSCGFTFLALNFKFSSTTVVSALQIHLFMQNEPNFRKSQMNVSDYTTMDYVKWTLGEHGKNEPKRTQNEPKRTQNEPKRTQNEPKLKKAKMNVNKVLTKDYENKPYRKLKENEPNTNPNKPNLKIPPQRVGRTKGRPLVTDVVEMKNICEPWAGRIVNNVRLVSFGTLCREIAGLVGQEVLSIEQGTLDFQYRERG